MWLSKKICPMFIIFTESFQSVLIKFFSIGWYYGSSKHCKPSNPFPGETIVFATFSVAMTGTSLICFSLTVGPVLLHSDTHKFGIAQLKVKKLFQRGTEII